MVPSGGATEKSPVTQPGIDPWTVRLVAQRLNHYATPGSCWGCSTTLKLMAFRSFEISITARRHFVFSQKTPIINSAVARVSNLASNCLSQCNYFRVSVKGQNTRKGHGWLGRFLYPQSILREKIPDISLHIDQKFTRFVWFSSWTDNEVDCVSFNSNHFTFVPTYSLWSHRKF